MGRFSAPSRREFLGAGLALGAAACGRVGGLSSLKEDDVPPRFLWKPQFTITDHKEFIPSLTFSQFRPDILVSSSWDGTVRLWDTRQKKLLWTAATEGIAYESVVASENGEYVLAVGKKGEILLLGLQKGEVIRRFSDGRAGTWYTTAAISRDNARIAAGTGDGRVIVWDQQTGRVAGQWAGHDNGVLSLRFSRQGDFLLSGDPQAAKLWNLREGGAPSRSLVDVSAGVEDVFWLQCLDFSPDESLVIAGAGNEIVIFDTQTGRITMRFKGHNKEVTQVKLSPDGKRVISTGRDHALIFWDVVSGKQIAVYVDASLALTSAMAVNSEGTQLATGGAFVDLRANAMTYKIRVFDLPPETRGS